MRNAICLFSLSLIAVGAPSVAAPRMTADQAVQKARDFCAAMHRSLPARADAKFPGGFDNYWQERWEVRFPGYATVCVVDSTGAISYYRDEAYRGRADLRDAAGKPISESRARALGAAALAASGGGNEVLFWRAQLMTEGDPKLRGGHQWVLGWHRKAGSWVYNHRSSVLITLDAEDGTIVSLSKIFPSPPPTTLAVRVSKQDATKTAVATLAELKLASGPVKKAELLIVQPNERWRVKPGQPRARGYLPERNTKRVSRLAWVLHFSNPTLEDYWRDVWVDAETGKVIGGETGGIARSATRAPPSLR